jgi:hypothetical protein
MMDLVVLSQEEFQTTGLYIDRNFVCLEYHAGVTCNTPKEIYQKLILRSEALLDVRSAFFYRNIGFLGTI